VAKSPIPKGKARSDAHLKKGAERQTVKEIKTAALQAAFLAAIRTTGNVSQAAAAAGIGRRTHYGWINDPEYATAFDDAMEEASDVLEAEAWRRAKDGVDEPVFYQGIECGAVRKYSDTLLIFLLKGARPEKYRERVDMNHKGISANSPEGILLLMAGQPIPGSKPEGD
jgi:hypothetical protein